jgi:hypothetical protein
MIAVVWILGSVGSITIRSEQITFDKILRELLQVPD